ncbi:hypothetical protein NPIL_151801 [Nephila pilipes]|uniref:Uncharacterized protein n=1 Tax=Nephila pilipes TaxID=299642 RepID=A0A8X6TVE3_NEPPI|nr:hypothetical protein NPIL_151801 [Nephila pilipes]
MGSQKGFIDIKVKGHNMKPIIIPLGGLPGVHFNTDILSPISTKEFDIPDYLRLNAMKTLCSIPSKALQIFTDGSKNEHNLSANGIFVKTSTSTANFTNKIRTAHCSVFWIGTNCN